MSRRPRMPAARYFMSPLAPLGVLAEDFSRLVRHPIRSRARRHAARPDILH